MNSFHGRSVTSQRHIDQVLVNQVSLFKGAFGLDVFLMANNGSEDEANVLQDISGMPTKIKIQRVRRSDNSHDRIAFNVFTSAPRNNMI